MGTGTMGTGRIGMRTGTMKRLLRAAAYYVLRSISVHVLIKAHFGYGAISRFRLELFRLPPNSSEWAKARPH